MREIRTSGSMSGSVETEYGQRILRHKRGNPDTDLSRSLNHRATSRLYPLGVCGSGIRRFLMTRSRVSVDLPDFSRNQDVILV